MSVIEQLERLGIDGVCEDAEKWISSHPGLDIQELWDICPRSDWMLYLLIELGADAPFRNMAYEFAAHAVQHVVSPELRDACCDTLDVVSQHIDDEATFDDMAAASTALDSVLAAVDTSDAWDVDRAVVDSVLAAVNTSNAWAVNTSDARDAAWAARASAWATSAARASTTADSVAWDAGSAALAAKVATRNAALAAQANIIRCFVPVAPVN